MRELMSAMADLEAQLLSRFDLSVNEAMALCCISCDTLTASVISENTGLLPSNTSKVLRSLENKELISRSLGQVDRRQMQFCLTETGRLRLQRLKSEGVDIPEFLMPLYRDSF